MLELLFMDHSVNAKRMPPSVFKKKGIGAYVRGCEWIGAFARGCESNVQRIAVSNFWSEVLCVEASNARSV